VGVELAEQSNWLDCLTRHGGLWFKSTDHLLWSAKQYQSEKQKRIE
jgi:hypothetical protein